MKFNTIFAVAIATLACKVSAECFAQQYGYECCKYTTNVVSTKNSIDFGLENGKKCAIQPAQTKKNGKGKGKGNNNGKGNGKGKGKGNNNGKGKGKGNGKNNAVVDWTGYMDKIEIINSCPPEIKVREEDVPYPEAVKVYYDSTTTGTKRPMNVILPVGYDESKKYPVMYYLHGIMWDEDTMLDEKFGTISIYTNLLNQGLTKEMIIVLPNEYAPAPGTAVEPSFNQSYFDGYDNFINDLINDIMPYMEKNYSIATGRENTAISGFSMGGRNSLYIAYSRPDLFGYVGSFSPAPGIVEADDQNGHQDGLMKPEELVADPPFIVSMLSCGDHDSVVGTFPKQYHEILEENNQEHIWFETPGDHDWPAHTAGYYNFLKTVFGVLNEQ